MNRSLVKFLCCALWLCWSSASFALYEFDGPGMMIDVRVNLEKLETPATLWVQVRDVETGAVTPLSLQLDRKLILHLLPTQSPEYTIERVFLQLPKGQNVPFCDVTRAALRHKNTVLSITGVLDARYALPDCHVSYESAQPITDADLNIKHAPQTQRAGANLETEAYMNALRTCSSGVYQANIDNPFSGARLGRDTLIVYGQQEDRCVVEFTRNITNQAGLSQPLVLDCRLPPAQINQTLTKIKTAQTEAGESLTDTSSPWENILCTNCSASLGGKKVVCQSNTSASSENTSSTTVASTGPTFKDVAGEKFKANLDENNISL